MRTLMLFALLLAGCAVTQHSETRPEMPRPSWPMVKLEPPPSPERYGVGEDKKSAMGNYAADTSLYAFYVFHHARAVNDYAEKNGWRPPMFIPLCEGFALPEVMPIPEKVTLDAESDTPQEMAVDVGRQLQRVLRQYRKERNELIKAYEKHRSTCLF